MPRTREIKQRFRSSIRRGTGEVYLLLRDNPKIDFSGEIIKACVKNFAYDGQCESSRAPYLHELILLYGKEEEIKVVILNSLERDYEDTWTLVQLFALARLYAEKGHTDAKDAIYTRFLKYPQSRADWAGYSEIIKLDGLNGLKFIASKIGEALQNNPDDWEDDGIIGHFQNENPGIDTWHELNEAGRNNQFIKTYLDGVRKTTENREKPPTLRVIYANVVEEVLFTKSRVKLSYRKWTKNELMLLAERLVIEKKYKNKAKLLRIFRKNKFPLGSDIILRIAKSKTTADVSYAAFDALGHLKNSEVRNFAINGLISSKNPQKYAVILKANYKKGDHKLLTQVIQNTNGEGSLEWLMVNILEIYHFNKTKECAAPLEALYNKSTCAIHRYDVLKLLMENDVLSSKIKDELIFDCNEDIRQLAQLEVIELISGD